MITKELINEIHTAYRQLELKKEEIARYLTHSEIESGWYNGHYQKNEDGNWRRDSYPIPVIGVKDLCDIEIQFDKISVSTKLNRDTALIYPFDKVKAYEFESYGVEDYLADYYHSGQTIQDLKDNIHSCTESQIGFSFIFPFETDGKQIFEFVKLLRQEKFYY